MLTILSPCQVIYRCVLDYALTAVLPNNRPPHLFQFPVMPPILNQVAMTVIDGHMYYVDRGELDQAVRYLNLLKGPSGKVASDWIQDVVVYLETRQAAELLLAHASAAIEPTLRRAKTNFSLSLGNPMEVQELTNRKCSDIGVKGCINRSSLLQRMTVGVG
ncbi:hypothetical protein J6590_051247 [Homalodisca vitripennis]|nr:hypothetical protein J6590_051247 [Homalodisca vitripennis]